MLAPWKKSYDQTRQHVKKQRHYLLTNVCLVKLGFSSGHVRMCELDCKESWAQKNWCFWTVVLGKLLTVPWTARRSNQSILKEISSEYSLEGLMLKLKLPVLWPPAAKNWLLEKTLMLGKIEGRRRKEQQRMRWLDSQLDGHEFGQTSLVGDGREAWRATVHVLAKSQTQLSDQTELNWTEKRNKRPQVESAVLRPLQQTKTKYLS